MGRRGHIPQPQRKFSSGDRELHSYLTARIQALQDEQTSQLRITLALRQQIVELDRRVTFHEAQLIILEKDLEAVEARRLVSRLRRLFAWVKAIVTALREHLKEPSTFAPFLPPIVVPEQSIQPSVTLSAHGTSTVDDEEPSTGTSSLSPTTSDPSSDLPIAEEAGSQTPPPPSSDEEVA